MEVPEIHEGYLVLRASVVDGDTVDMLIDNGFGSRAEERIRLVREKPGAKDFDAPETRGSERDEGIRAAHRLADLMAIAVEVRVRTFRDKKWRERKGKWGRYLGQLFVCLPDAGWTNTAQQLVDEGLAEVG